MLYITAPVSTICRDEMLENLQRPSNAQGLAYQMSNLQVSGPQQSAPAPSSGAYPSGPYHQAYPTPGTPPPPPPPSAQQAYHAPSREGSYTQSYGQWPPVNAPQQPPQYAQQAAQTHGASGPSYDNPMHQSSAPPQQQPAAQPSHTQNVASYFTDLFK